jgi:hypothetical protein
MTESLEAILEIENYYDFVEYAGDYLAEQFDPQQFHNIVISFPTHAQENFSENGLY